MSLQAVNALLDRYNSVYTHQLEIDSPRIETSPFSEFPLYQHQQRSLHRMEHLETKLPSGMPIESSTFYSSYAILADPIGSGKTVTALSHIARMKDIAPLPRIQLHPQSSHACYSTTTQVDRPHTLYNTLIVVPHTLFTQWIDIAKKTSLRVLSFCSIRDLRMESLWESLETADCVIITNTFLKQFLTRLYTRDQETTWRRVFYDEAHMIHIAGKVPQVKTYFTWFITQTFESILFHSFFLHSYTIRQLSEERRASFHPELQAILQQFFTTTATRFITLFRIQSSTYFQPFLCSAHPYLYTLVVRGSPQSIQESMNLPPLTLRSIQCRSIQMTQQLTLPTSVLTTLQTSIAPILSDYQIQSHPLSMSTVNSETICPICYEYKEQWFKTSCCNQLFCTYCMLHTLTMSSLCPLCRHVIPPTSLTHYSDPPITLPPALPSRIDVAVDILSNLKGKCIVYSRNSVMLDAIYERLPASISYRFFSGSRQRLNTMMYEFKKGIVKVLFIDYSTPISGIELLPATHILILNKITEYQRNYIIGRTHRLGQTHPVECIECVS